jgi:ferredoxin-NADP reductase
MSTATLSSLIGVLILGQVAGFALVARHRYRDKFRALPTQAFGDRPGAPTHRIPSDAKQENRDNVDPDELGAFPSAWAGYKEFVVRQRTLEDRKGDVCSFRLVPADGARLPAFRPGQYLTFKLEIPNGDDGSTKSVVRCYSLSDRPRSDLYRISIKRVAPPPGRADLPWGVASSHFHNLVREGTRLAVRAPSGHFHLIEDGDLPIVLIAGGIGITPMLSILNALAHWADPREVWLFYGLRNGTEHIMKEHLETLRDTHPGFHLRVVYANPSDEDIPGIDYHHQGYIDIRLLQEVLNLGRYEYYVCGPPPMMEALVPALETAGVPTWNIHYESFGPASLNRGHTSTQAQGESPITVRFGKSGTSVSWDPSASESLLELIEDQGIRVNSGCRAGSCGCCETRIEAGEVLYRQQPDADVKPGHCLLCIATPSTDLTLDI